MGVFNIPFDESGMTPEEFARALKDRVFVDYLNVYLSLPIFSQRVLYKYFDKDFEFDPPIKRRGQVWERSKLIDWLLRERINHFMKSELYQDYILCKDLLDTDLHLTEDSRKLDYCDIDTINDRELLREHIGHVIGMCKLQKFLKGTMGEPLLLFCKDAEHFRRLSMGDEKHRKQMFRVLQIKYFRPGGFFCAEDPQVWKALEDSSSAVREELSFITDFRSHRPPPHSFGHLTMLMRCLLKSYWLPRYMLRCRRQDTSKALEEDLLKVKSLSDLGVVQQLRSIDRVMALVQGNLKQHKRTLRNKSEVTWNALFPQCDVDDTFLGDSDDVITYHPDGSIVLERIGTGTRPADDLDMESLTTATSASFDEIIRTITFESGTDSELSLTKSDTESDTSPIEVFPAKLPPIETKPLQRDEEGRRRFNLKLPPLVSDQTLPTIHSKQVLNPHRPRTSPSRELGVTLPAMQTRKYPNPLRPRTQGSSRLVLPPILESRAESPGDVKPDCHYHRTLRITPVTPDSVEDMNRAFVREHLSLTRALGADALAGGPMLTYLRRTNDHAFAEMSLWQQCQNYLTLEPLLSETGDVTHHLRYRYARNMILQHLLPASESHVTLPDTMADDLVQLLPDDEGSSLLRDAQDHLTTVLAPVWQAYCLWDRETFLNSVVMRKPARLHSLMTGVGVEKMSEETYTAPLEQQDLSVGLARYGDADAKAPLPDEGWPPVDNEQDYMSISDRRTWRALRLSLEVSRIDPYQVALDDGPLEELEYTLETQMGSLAVKKLVSVRRGDLVDDFERRRQLAMAAYAARLKREREAAAILLAVQQSEIDDDLPPFARPFRKQGAWVHRPPKPRTFSEMMRNPVHVEFFKRFLMFHSAETPINYWLAVEELKACKDPRVRQQTVNQILRRYFISAKRYAELDSTAEVIREIPKMDKVTPAMLVSAQSCIASSLDSKWYNIYMATFPETLGEKVSSANILTDPGAHKWGKEKTRELWKQFVRGVVRLRECILNDQQRHKQFSDYLRQETAKEIARQRAMGNTSIGVGVPIRKVIINKLIDMGKLVADLSFLAEGERYRTLCDNATEAAKTGIYRTGDQQLLELKAKTIIDCYLDSEIHPKIQVNISQEISENVVANFNSGLVDRSLFHDAWIAVFPIVAYLWKKFMRQRVMSMFVRPDAPDALVSRKTSTPRIGTPNFMNMRIENARLIVAQSYGDDDHTRIIFSMGLGLRIVKPILQERGSSEALHLDEQGQPTNLWNDPGVDPELFKSPAHGEGDDGLVEPGSFHGSRRRMSLAGSRFGGLGSQPSMVGGRRHSMIGGKIEDSSHSVTDGTRSRIAGSLHGKLAGSLHGRMAGSQHGKLVDSQHSKLAGSQHSKVVLSQHSRLIGSQHSKLQLGSHHGKLTDSLHSHGSYHKTQQSSNTSVDSKHQLHANRKNKNSHGTSKGGHKKEDPPPEDKPQKQRFSIGQGETTDDLGRRLSVLVAQDDK